MLAITQGEYVKRTDGNPMNQHSKQLGEEATGNGPLKRRVTGDLADWCPGSQMNKEKAATRKIKNEKAAASNAVQRSQASVVWQ